MGTTRIFTWKYYYEQILNTSFKFTTYKSWRIFIILSIITNYLCVSYTYVFERNSPNAGLYYLILFCDVLYAWDKLLNLFILVCKLMEFHVDLESSRGVTAMLDFLLLFPYSYIVQIATKSSISTTFLCLRAISCLRIYHLIIVRRRASIPLLFVKYAIIFFLLHHTMACVWYLQVSPLGSWADNLQEHFNPENHLEWYLLCLYFAVLNSGNVNFGDVFPTSQIEKLTALFGMLGGYLLLIIFTASLIFHLIELRKRKDTKMKPCLQILPLSLQRELFYDLHVDFLQNFPIFLEQPSEFLRFIATLVKEESFHKGDLIFDRGVVRSKMIYIVKGEIEVMSAEDTVLIAFGPRTSFGECSLILSVPSKNTIHASTDLELKVLYRKDFLQTGTLFPSDYIHFYNTVMERIRESQFREIPIEQALIEELYSFTAVGTEPSSLAALKKRLKEQTYKKKIPSYFAHSCLTSLWTILVGIDALFIAICYPFLSTFFSAFPSWMGTITIFADTILTVDIFVILLKGAKNRSSLFRNLTLHLNTFPFYLDLFSAVHLEIFCYLFTNHVNEAFFVLKLNRLAKSYRIFYFLRTKMLKYAAGFVLLSYWFGAFLYIVTCFETCVEDGWFYIFEDQDRKHILNHILVSWYFSLSILTGTAYGDILPHNKLETIVVYLIILVAIGLFGYGVSKLSKLQSLFLQSSEKYRQCMLFVDKCLKRERIEKVVRKTLKKAFYLHWYYNEGIWTQLPKNDKSELASKIEIIKGSLFSNLSVDFLYLLGLISKTLILRHNEIVINEGETLESLYFIQEGYCIQESYFYDYTIGPKSYFGNVGFVPNIRARYTIKTLTGAKIIYITMQDFRKLALVFPSILKLFIDVLRSSKYKEHKSNTVIASRFSRETYDHEMFYSKSSIINVLTYCHLQTESYRKPFKERKLCWLQFVIIPICISPSGVVFKCWTVFRANVALILAFLTPFHVVYYPKSFTINSVILTLDIIAYADIYFRFFVGYFGPESQLIVHPVKTIGHYLQTQFILDFLLCFPWYILVHSKANIWAKFLIGAAKVAQIYKFVQTCNYFSSQIKSKSTIIKMAKLVTLMILLVHIASSIIVLAGPKTNPSTNEDFLTSLVFGTSTFSRSGFRNIVRIENNGFLAIIILMIIFSFSYLCFFYFNILNLFSDHNSALSKYREEVRHLRRFLVGFNLRSAHLAQLNMHLQHAWHKNFNIIYSDILRRIRPHLNRKIQSALYASVLREIPFLEGIGVEFLKTLAQELTVRHFLKGQIICRMKDVTSEILILSKGKVEILYTDDAANIINVGGVFGNLTIRPKGKILVTAAALSDVECLTIETEVFIRILKHHVSYKDIIEDVLQMDPDCIMSKKDMEQSDYNVQVAFKRDISTDEGTITSIDSYNTAKKVPKGDQGHKLFPPKKCICLHTFLVVISPLIGYLSLLLALVNCYLTTYHFAFQDHSIPVLSAAIVIDNIFVINVLLEIYGGRFKEKNWRLAFEIGLNCPLHYFALLLHHNKYLLIHSAIRMLTIVRFIYVLEFYSKRSKKLVQVLFLKISLVVIWFPLALHLLGCFWYLLCCHIRNCRTSRYENMGKVEIYINSIYIVSEIFTGSTGDIIPEDQPTKIYFIVIMMVSVLLGAILLANILNIFITSLRGYANVQREIEEIQEYFSNRGLSQLNMRRLRHYTNALWTKRHRIMPPIIRELTYDDRCTLMHILYGDHLKACQIFASAEEAFLRQLVIHLKLSFFFRGDFIVKQGDSDESMHFIDDGEVEIFTFQSNVKDNIVHALLLPRDMFGLVQGLFHGVPHHFSFRARRNSRMLSLQLSDWESLLDYFPNSKRSIYMKANDLYNRF